MHTLDDFRKMYEGCFVLLEGNHLALFNETTGSTLEFKTREAGTITMPAKQESFSKVSHVFPERGIYNINDRAYLFSRIAARQWKRAPCNKNATIKSVLRCIDSDWETPPAFTLDTMEQIFHPKYYTLREALTLPNLYSRGLSLSFAISISNTPKFDALLWFNSRAIGYIKNEGRIIILHNQSFREEVLDYIRTTEPTWTLTVQHQ